MTTASRSARDPAIDSPRSQRSARAREGPSKTLATQEVPAPALRENAFNVDSVMLDSGIAAHQPRIIGASPNTSSKGFSKLGQLAKRAIGKHSINDPQRRAEEGRPSTSARGLSPLAASPAGSSSQTIHVPDAYEGTTVTGHEALPIEHAFGSPIYVEPKPTNDYAKMELPRASIVSFDSFIHRVRQFLHELNDLPWVAERVTVDYVPGAERDRRRPRVIQRPLSWYGNTPLSRRPSLFSDSPSPTSQPSQVQLPHPTPLQPSALYRSISAQQEPQPEVFWQIIDPANPSDAPYATVVPANWSIHQPLPLDHHEPTIPNPQTQDPSRPPYEPQPTANPPSVIPQQPASILSHPDRPTDGFPKFVPIGETFPTGYVPYAHVGSVEAAYQDRKFHPRPQDLAPQDLVPPHSEPASAGTGVAHPVQGGFGMDAPQTARGLDEPFTTSLGQAGSASLPASSVQTPYNPNAQHSVVAPMPRKASWSTAPTTGVVPANVEATPRATAVSPRSPPGNPPSVAASRTTQRSHGRAPSVRTMQSEDRPNGSPPSVAASRTTQRSHGRAPSVRTVQSTDRPPSVSSSHATVPSAANQTQARNRPPSLAQSHVSRPPSATVPATPNRPPSATLSHGSRAPSARASQSRPVSIARSHASRTPSAGAHTPGPMQFPQPVIPSAA